MARSKRQRTIEGVALVLFGAVILVGMIFLFASLLPPSYWSYGGMWAVTALSLVLGWFVPEIARPYGCLNRLAFLAFLLVLPFARGFLPSSTWASVAPYAIAYQISFLAGACLHALYDMAAQYRRKYRRRARGSHARHEELR